MIFLCNVLILVFLAGGRELSYKEVRWDQKCVFVVHFWDRWQNFVFCRFIRQHWGLRNYTVVLKWLFKETSNMKKVWIFWFILPIHTVFPSPAPNLQNDEKKSQDFTVFAVTFSAEGVKPSILTYIFFFYEIQNILHIVGVY